MTTNFEAKLHGFRRTQDGVVVSYVVHPNDVSTELATAALGTRYMVAVAEIGDDERPKESALLSTADKAPEDVPPSSSGATKRKFSELPCSQQAGMRCGEQTFWEFLNDKYPLACSGVAGDAAAALRLVCDVESRTWFDTYPGKSDKWRMVEKQYQAYLTTQQYAGVRR